MKKSTIEAICKYLFWGISLPLFVLGHDSCSMLKCRTPYGQMSYFTVPGTSKELFLRNLDNLFNKYTDRFTSANTIVVDDSPSKHIMNNPQNVVLPRSWSHIGDGRGDNFLLSDLLHWIQRLHESAEAGLLIFRRNNSFGCKMLCEDPNPRYFNELMDVVNRSRYIQ